MNGNNCKSAVYSCKEKILLVKLIKENEVIENKRSDGATLLEKKKAWESIANTYNSQAEVIHLRTPEQLRKLWNNLKQRKRKERTALRYSMLATKPDVVLDFVEDAAPHLDVSIDCPFESTQLFEIGQTETKNLLEETADSEEVKCELPALQDVSDHHVLPSTSKSKVSVSTPTSRKAVPVPAVLTENNRWMKKLVDVTQQQQELHDIEKKIAEEELLRVKLEVQRAELQKQAAEFDLQRASDEAELVSLKLKQFRKRMLSEDL